MKIRYHLDEHIDPAVAAGLRRRGVDVSTTDETNLTAASDKDQLAFAAVQRRVLVTRDSDFLVIASQGAAHAGIVFWHAKRRNVGQLVLDLVVPWRAVTAEEMDGRIEYV